MDDLTAVSKVSDPDQETQLLSWGCGEFGQHGHGGSGENVNSEGALVDHVEALVGSHCIRYASCGASHTAVVTDQDDILTWGNGNSGQLGCGDKATHTSPQRLRLGPHDSQVAGVACGSRHTVVWLVNGRAYSCGNNFYAQLGYDFRIKNYKENQVLPHFLRPIMHKKVVQVSCGEKFTLFLFESGQVGGCGANSFGQLGNGTRAEVVSPKPLEDPENVVSIGAGACHSLAVTASGEVYVWGMGRPCGSRRDDLLTPQRRTTRHSNVVSVAGGSSHSLALTADDDAHVVAACPHRRGELSKRFTQLYIHVAYTSIANGTVYSWGGGVDGQLGHGEDVQYLAQPKALDEDAFPGRVSQVACGDSYSAALLADGSLYMWGKSSHVIEADQPSSRKIFHPVSVPLNGRSVAMVTCGSWHTAAITGKPVRQPLEEDSESSADEDDNLETFITKETSDGEDAFQKRVDNFWDMSEETAALENNNIEPNLATSDRPAMNLSKPPYMLAREGTTLTLEEFYSATPVPSLRPRELRRASLADRKRAAQEGGVQGSDEQINPEAMEEEMGKHLLDGSEVEESSMDDNVDEESVVMTHIVDSADEAETAMNDSRPKVEPSSTLSNTSISPSKTVHAPLQRDMSMARSKTMGSIHEPKKSVPKGNLPRVYDMSVMSGAGDADRGTAGKFVVDKHIAIQSRKGSPSSSSPSSSASSSSSSRRKQVNTKQTIAMVSMVGSVSGDLPSSNDKVTNSLPVPKMTRAHTLYGPMRTQGKIKHSESKPTPVIHPVPPMVSIAYKTRPSIGKERAHPAGNSKYGTKGGSPSLKELKHQSQPMHGTSSQSRSVGGRRPLGATTSAQKRPVFSSAASWRQRSEVDDVLIGDRKPPGSPQQRKGSTKDV